MNKKSNIQTKVLKFGGTSLASAENIKKVAAIIKSDPERRYVIPSAPGKRFPADTKVTDMLLECYKLCDEGKDFYGCLKTIKSRYEEIIRGLGCATDLNDEFETVNKNLLAGTTIDYMASRGEYINGIILADYLGFDFIDPSGFIVFDDEGVFDSERTDLLIGEELKKHDYAVIPGFYGTKPNGEIKTFSRGGSDITGAIVSRAVMADIYENWTDVSGFLVCDPRIVSDTKQIKVLTYRELRELSYMGAGVLHPDSIFPVKLAGIPINIRNTLKPDDDGTMIVPSSTDNKNDSIITGIAGKKGFSVIRLEKDMMNQEKGFGMKVLQVFSELDISFEHLPSGIDTMCVVVNTEDIKGMETEIFNRLSASVNPDNTYLESGMSLIAVVGRGMINTPGTAARIFSAISNENINIRMIDQGSSELNIILGVDEKDFEKAIRVIYNEFC